MVVVEARVVDPTHLELLEPIEAPLGRKVVVSVRDIGENDERELWMTVSERGLLSAYGESEPEYSVDMVREPNPEFAG